MEPFLTFLYPDRLLSKFAMHWKVFILMNLHGMPLVIIRLLAQLASLFMQTLRSTTLLKVPTNLNTTVIIAEKKNSIKTPTQRTINNFPLTRTESLFARPFGS